MRPRHAYAAGLDSSLGTRRDRIMRGLVNFVGKLPGLGNLIKWAEASRRNASCRNSLQAPFVIGGRNAARLTKVNHW